MLSSAELERRAKNLKRILEARKSPHHPLTLLRALTAKAIANGSPVLKERTL